MYDQDHDLESELASTRDFWADEHPRALDRIGARRRPAGSPPPRPTRPWQTHLHDERFDDDVVTSPRERLGRVAEMAPLARRLGVLAIAFLVLAPVALIIRNVDAEGSAPASQVTTLAVGTAPGSGAAATPSTVEHVPPRERSTSSSDATTTVTQSTKVLPKLNADPVAAPPSATQPRTEAAPATTAPKPVACTKKYTIVSGDSWSRIADKVKITMKELLVANNATTGTLLLPGRTLCLPANATLPSPTTTTAARAPSTTQPVSRPSYSPAQIQQIIREVWPDELEAKALMIAQRESNLNPYVSNSCCYGVFQINWNAHRGWLVNFGVTSASQLYDPRVNTRMALEIYRRSNGWGPWGG